MMSLFSGNNAVVPTQPNSLDRVKQALGTIKSALDERDNWEILAAEDEKRQVSKMNAASKPATSRARGGRGGGKTSRANKSDLRVKPPSITNIPRRVPRSLKNAVTWSIDKIDLTDINTGTGGGGVVENNYTFTQSQSPNTIQWRALFDQFYIAQVSLTFVSALPPGATYGEAILHTALDFDNATGISTLAAIDEYSTSQFDPMSTGKTITRSIKPCQKNTVSGGANTGLTRTWIDCGTGSANAHYGIRSIVDNSAVTTAYSIKVIQTMWIAYRDAI